LGLRFSGGFGPFGRLILGGDFAVMQAFGANVAVSNRKQLVFVSSAAGSIARAQSNNYVNRSPKAALNMAVRCLSLEIAERGMIANLLCPGSVSTDMNPATNLTASANHLGGGGDPARPGNLRTSSLRSEVEIHKTSGDKIDYPVRNMPTVTIFGAINLGH